MFNGTHLVQFSHDAEADRAFLQDVLEFPAVDAGGGWLIFRLPPSEVACHPVDADGSAGECRIYLMTDDLARTTTLLAERGVSCAQPRDEGWGIVTSVPLPSGAQMGLYQPRHPTALEE